VTTLKQRTMHSGEYKLLHDSIMMEELMDLYVL
jgi:hypothetical protein